MTEPDIDALLRQDEAELREKRKRLKAFAGALADVRSAHEKASKLAGELLDSGDVTRTDLGRVFDLSKGERTVLVPPARRGSHAGAQGQRSDAASSKDDGVGDGVDNAQR